MRTGEICQPILCTGCGVCVASCRQSAIIMQCNAEGFLYPEINEALCVDCGLCIKRCPINTDTERHSAVFYMGRHKDPGVLQRSSSGGIFTALAELILAKGGIVVGAYLDEKTREVRHITIESFNEIDKLRKSKYYQSIAENTYAIVKESLTAGRYVLFTGTACQCAALKNFLGHLADSDLLITADVLCHGVTSKKVVDKYIKSKEKHYHKSIKSYAFRIKWPDGEWQRGGY